MRTGDGRPLAPFLRRDIERMLRRYVLISQQIQEVVAHRKKALADKSGHFPQAEVRASGDARRRRRDEQRLCSLPRCTIARSKAAARGIVRRTRTLAPNSGDTDRDRGISKAGTKLAPANTGRAGLVLAPLPAQ